MRVLSARTLYDGAPVRVDGLALAGRVPGGAAAAAARSPHARAHGAAAAVMAALEPLDRVLVGGAGALVVARVVVLAAALGRGAGRAVQGRRSVAGRGVCVCQVKQC